MATTEKRSHDDAQPTTDDRDATYTGYRRSTERNRVVGPDGRQLDPRTDLANHSPTGLEWGYGGSGPAQLALALLADHYADTVAFDHYQDFKNDVVATLDGDEWAINVATVENYLDPAQIEDSTPTTEISGPHDEIINGEPTGETFYRCEGCGMESLSSDLKMNGCPRCD
ncbi:DUF6166 domain-containing protein [Halococcus sp. PRR34]|uniref:DUF6166 domain-containing protein n=1 Tax=Halococcus sp. PRR34 TaxID=3020830 RepID=UPI00236050E1|nr:DUF6166 domain-containing protein [Halococcus sp. PRR34]